MKRYVKNTILYEHPNIEMANSIWFIWYRWLAFILLKIIFLFDHHQYLYRLANQKIIVSPFLLEITESMHTYSFQQVKTLRK